MTLQTDILGNPNYKPVLNFGFVGLVDSMGDDSRIVQAARVSYGSGTKTAREDRGLIRYLFRHFHTTPLEMVVFCFHLKFPIIVSRQHSRHRMSSTNEYSGRYSVMSDEFYIPNEDRIQSQHAINKQGSGDALDPKTQKQAVEIIDDLTQFCYKNYQELLDLGVSREVARSVLPVSNFTEMYWKIDLHNLLNYLYLRMDSHAQWEIQQFANAIAEFVKEKCPIAWEAYVDYKQNAVNFSGPDMSFLNHIIAENSKSGLTLKSVIAQEKALWENETKFLNRWNLTKTEYNELLTKFNLA
jgi:thymidylate synthase (FAD)